MAYQLNHVVALEPPGPVPAPLPDGLALDRLGTGDLAAISAHPAHEVRKAAGYVTAARRAFVLRQTGGAPCAVAVFTPADRFGRSDIARLALGEWALVELVTWPEHAGRGLGTLMVQHAARAMFDAGARRLVSFMWWSHRASLRVFLKAGWRRTAFAIAVGPGPGRWLALRLPPWLAPGA